MTRQGSAHPRIALAIRVRDEWSLVVGLLESLAGVCQEAWILDDASAEPAPPTVRTALPRVVIHRAREWSGTGGRMGEGLQRDFLLQSIKRDGAVDWILQLDADERLGDPSALLPLAATADVDGWVLPLVDYYITPADAASEDTVQPGRVREWFGPETRWTLALFRPTSSAYISRGDVREPQGFDRGRVRSTSACSIEHFGKSVSVAAWERKADFYIANYPEYRDKWRARKGAAVHHGVSDFGTQLLRRGDPFRPEEAPTIHRYRQERGWRDASKRWFYGRWAPSLRTLATTMEETRP